MILFLTNYLKGIKRLKYLPEPKDYYKYYYIDLETELIPAIGPIGIKKIWMMCASRMDSDEVYSFIGHEEIRQFFNNLKGEEIYFVGHSATSFDAPISARICMGAANISNTVDTLVLSYLYDPGMLGGHSLYAWGERLKDPKGDFNDFSGYSHEMDRYCQQDVRLGKKIFKALVTRMLRMGFSELSCEIEHHIREVVDEQQNNGWYFDIPGAQSLVSQLRSEQSNLEGPIRSLFPPRLQPENTYNRRKKKDGSEFESYLRHLREFPKVENNDDGTYTTYDWEEFNIGSPAQRTSRLLGLGYQPTSFTPKTQKGGGGNPKVDEESLLAFAEESGLKEVTAIAEWLVLQGRSTMVEGWLNNVNYDDHCMHGKVLTCGATTRRMTHFGPNCANIPKANPKVKYGKECRQLWQCRPGRKQVGADASGLELRMFAQYLNDPEATKLYTEGDPHMYNTNLLGLPAEARGSTSKTMIFGLLYGAQDKKLGRILQPTLTDKAAAILGSKARDQLQSGIPGMKRLVAEVQDEYNHTGGLLKTIDGGYVRAPSLHAAINYKLQSAGAILMKKADILFRNSVKKQGLDSMQTGNIHDEIQNDTAEKDTDEVGKACVRAMTDAGEELGFHVPITGTYSIGSNWSNTH